jgi:tetratricopeptide (TPR) repeat protein
MQPQLSRDPEGSAVGLRWAAMLVILLATAAAYMGSLRGPFIYDDHHWITWNPAIRHLWPLSSVFSPVRGSAVYGRPVLSFSFAVNYALGGENPWGYHVANMVIHLLAALALFGVVRRTLAHVPASFPTEHDRTLAAFAVALVWAVHPLQSESVTYVAQRAESLMGLFYLLTLYCFIRSLEEEKPRPWQLAALLCCLLGMGVKQVMVTAPFIVLVYDRTFAAGSFLGALRRRWAFYLGLACTWFPLVSLGGAMSGWGVGYKLGYTWWTYGLTECWVICHYLMLAFWPHPLVFDYGADVVAGVRETLPWVMVLVVLAGAAFIAFLRRTALGFAAVCFFAILSPSSSVIPVAFEPMAESRMYLPLAAVVAVAVAGLWAILGRKSVPVLLAAALALGLATRERNRAYRSDVAIWTDNVLHRPTNPRAHLALGSALAMEWKNEEAAQQFEETLKIDPGDFEARRNLGLAYYHLGRADAALAEYRTIAPPTPDSAALHYDIGLALDLAGRTAEAAGEYARAVQLNPGDTEAHNNLGSALFRTGHPSEAVAQYGLALALSPNLARVHYNLAITLASMGGLQRAADEYREALRIDPGYAEAHNNLGNLLEEMGDAAGALAEYREAARIKPDYALARANLARLGATPAPR